MSLTRLHRSPTVIMIVQSTMRSNKLVIKICSSRLTKHATLLVTCVAIKFINELYQWDKAHINTTEQIVLESSRCVMIEKNQ